MEGFFKLVYYFTFVPKIITGIVLLYIIFKILTSFYHTVLLSEEGLTLKNIFHFIDPYKQSIFYYKYNFILILILLSLIALFYYLYIPPKITDGGYVKYNLLINRLTYLPNYLVHEFSHRFWAVFGWRWWTTLSGSFIEILFPCFIYLFSLQLRGGQFFAPILFYWISTTLYDTGIYASDAVACKLALTGSDMISSAKPGTVKGDWYYILKPLNLLDYAEKIGMILEILACIFLAFAIYSIINYFIQLAADPRLENKDI